MKMLVSLFKTLSISLFLVCISGASSAQSTLSNVRVPAIVDGIAVNNYSCLTLCAEADNINVPVYGNLSNPVVSDKTDIGDYHFRITATHPKYPIKDYTCAPDFRGCPPEDFALSDAPQATCTDPLFDDGVNVIVVCVEDPWWLPSLMSVTVGENTELGSYVRWQSRIGQTSLYPEFMAFYGDSYLRLKPFSRDLTATNGKDNCYGSSVIVGPAEMSERPFAEVTSVTIDPSTMCMEVTYDGGGTATICFNVNRDRAIADVNVNYPVATYDVVSPPLTPQPFAVFRSNYVSKVKNDVTNVKSGDKNPQILNWNVLKGSNWLFHRATPSKIRQSAPNIQIAIAK